MQCSVATREAGWASRGRWRLPVAPREGGAWPCERGDARRARDKDGAAAAIRPGGWGVVVGGQSATRYLRVAGRAVARAARHGGRASRPSGHGGDGGLACVLALRRAFARARCGGWDSWLGPRLSYNFVCQSVRECGGQPRRACACSGDRASALVSSRRGRQAAACAPQAFKVYTGRQTA